MNQTDIAHILENKRHPLTFFNCWRYLVMLFPGFIVTLGLSICLSEGLKKPFIFIWPVIIIIGIYLVKTTFKHIESDRKFYSIYTRVTDVNVIVECIKTLGCRIVVENQAIVIAETKMSLTSWGEIITVVIKEGELLFNSRPSESPASSSRDINNFWRFYRQIELKENQLQLTEHLQKHG